MNPSADESGGKGRGLWRVVLRVVGLGMAAVGFVLLVREAVLTEQHSVIPVQDGIGPAMSGSFRMSLEPLALCVGGVVLVAVTFWPRSGKDGRSIP